MKPCGTAGKPGGKQEDKAKPEHREKPASRLNCNLFGSSYSGSKWLKIACWRIGRAWCESFRIPGRLALDPGQGSQGTDRRLPGLAATFLFEGVRLPNLKASLPAPALLPLALQCERGPEVWGLPALSPPHLYLGIPERRSRPLSLPEHSSIELLHQFRSSSIFHLP